MAEQPDMNESDTRIISSDTKDNDIKTNIETFSHLTSDAINEYILKHPVK